MRFDSTQRRRRRRLRALVFPMVIALVALLADSAGASVVTYWSGTRASGSWYVVPGYWSYYGNEVSGPGGVTYAAAMYTSSGYLVASGSSWNYVYVGYGGGLYVSPRCMQQSGGSVNFWCNAYY